MATTRRRKKKRFRMQPRFFLVIFVLVAAVLIGVLVVKKLSEPEAPVEAEATPLPTATPGPTATPKPSLPPNVTVVRGESANPSLLGFSYDIMANRKEVSSYSRSDAVSFGRDSEYSAIPGVLTFGGNNYRNTFTYGTQVITDKRLREQWSKNIGGIESWTGTGWTGQPLIVHWPAETLQWMNVKEEFKSKEGGLTEVVYPAMDGVIYFLELETGSITRDPLSTGVVQKGTACIDPRGYPLLFVGQGIPAANDEGNHAAYLRVFSLLDGKVLAEFGGFDYFGNRQWQAYDGSPIVSGDTIVYGGENGILYTRKLNASFDPATGALSMEPEQFVKYRYKGAGYSKDDAAGSRWYGIESSVSAFRNFAFFSDNGGRLQCVDLNNMQLKYVVDLTDETDATSVIEESFEDNTFYLYTGSQVRAENSAVGVPGFGYSYQRKINGLTGQVVWEQKQVCGIGDATSSGGMVATPHAGRFNSNISSLVIYPLSLAAMTGQTGVLTAPAADGGAAASPGPETAAPTDAAADDASAAPASLTGYTMGGRIVALDKSTGQVVWAVEQDEDYWSSPVVVYDEKGNAYLIQCDRGGIVTLYDASTGTKLNTVDLGSRIDSTPAVYDNFLIVGTRGKGGSGKAAKISCVKIS